MYDKIQDLLSLNPLPVDAEAQLDLLIEALPEAERVQARESYHEALAVAQFAQDAFEIELSADSE